jgi:hypothetical protein
MEIEQLFNNMTVNEMKSALADREMELLDFGATYSILMEGCKGYNHMSNEEIEEQYITYFGDNVKREVEFDFS